MAQAQLLEAFHEKGWCAVEGVFSPSAMENLKETAVDCCERELQGEILSIVREGTIRTPLEPEEAKAVATAASDVAANGELVPRKLVASNLKPQPSTPSHFRIIRVSGCLSTIDKRPVLRSRLAPNMRHLRRQP